MQTPSHSLRRSSGWAGTALLAMRTECFFDDSPIPGFALSAARRARDVEVVLDGWIPIPVDRERDDIALWNVALFNMEGRPSFAGFVLDYDAIDRSGLEPAIMGWQPELAYLWLCGAGDAGYGEQYDWQATVQRPYDPRNMSPALQQ